MDSQLDYKAVAETLKQKTTQAGTDVLELRTWLGTQPEAWRQAEESKVKELMKN